MRLTNDEHRQVSLEAGHSGSWYTLADLLAWLRRHGK